MTDAIAHIGALSRDAGEDDRQPAANPLAADLQAKYVASRWAWREANGLPHKHKRGE